MADWLPGVLSYDARRRDASATAYSPPKPIISSLPRRFFSNWFAFDGGEALGDRLFF